VTFLSEFRLALDCCRRSFASGAIEPIALPPTIDWAKFLHLISFHRIEGLAWNALSGVEIPSETRAALAETASAIAVQNLQAGAECRSLLDRFETARVPLLFLKGLTLGALVYGNPAIKSAIDVDLLIEPNDLSMAVDLLRSAGYEFLAPNIPATDEALHGWHAAWKESVWTKASPRVQIDLHTRTSDNVRLAPTIDVHSARQRVEVAAGIHLPTLATDELFAYLAVHGASSAWFRLKWISDFAALVHGRSGEEIVRLYRRSQDLGAGRAAGQALLLADSLFNTLQSAPDLRAQLMSDRATRSLYCAALRLVTGAPREPTASRAGTLTIHWTQFLLLPGLGYKLSELRRQVSRLVTAV
jgi:hypothetical protein